MLDTPEVEATKQEKDVRSSMPSLEGELLSGRYRIEAELGTGGMGAVYRAEHTLMRKRVAVKILHPEMTRLPEVVERFEREAMAAAHIEHPNVAAATDFGKLENGSFFLVLEYVEGDSLRDVLQDGPMDPRRVIHVAKQIVAALVRAHSLGIVHRDLKPENVMLVHRDGDPDFVKVLDFGIAKVPVGQISKEAGKQHKTLTKVGMVYGTPEYMAPEQALGQDVDARADLYALGVIFYEMLVGRRPFEADNPVALLGMQVTQPPPPFRQVAPSLQIPMEIETVVMELLEKEAARRPTDAKQVRDALEYLEQAFGSVPSDPREASAMVARAATSLTRAPTVFEGVSPKAHGRPVVSLMVRVSEQLERVQQAIRPSRIYRLAEQLRGQVPAPMRSFGLAVWAGLALGIGLFAMVAVGLLAWWVSTPDTIRPAFDDDNWPPPAMSSAVKSASATADRQELKRAAQEGGDALEKIFERFPNDPRVLEHVAEVRLTGPAPASAIEVYEKLFLLEPAKRGDATVIDGLVKAAGRAGSQDAVFEMLESHMGTQGPDVLHDLAYGKRTAPPAVVSRAGKSLKSDAVRKHASPALLVALDLRFNGGCQAKHKLLDRAREHGDERSLSQLRGLLHAKGCGFLGLSDCWKCMRADRKLSDAIKAISERTKAEPEPASSAE
jgi:serine/threonine protein kinase